MPTDTLLFLIFGGVGVLLTGLGLWKQLRDSKAADRAAASLRAAKKLADLKAAADRRVAETRQEERDRCAEEKRALVDRLAEVTADRNREFARAESYLQTLLEQRRNGGAS